MYILNTSKYCFLLPLSVANADYQPGPYTVEMAANSNEGSVSVTIVDDRTVEALESFRCTLSISADLKAKGFEVNPSAANVDISITDNDGMQANAKHV